MRSTGVPDGLVELVARRLWVLGEPTRIRLLLSLQEREASVQVLADELGSTHQGVSKHLVLLAREGILSRRREGNTARYAVADYTARPLLEQAAASVTGHIEELADRAHPEI